MPFCSPWRTNINNKLQTLLEFHQSALTYPSHNIALIIGAHRPSNIMPVCSIDADRLKGRWGGMLEGEGTHAFAIFPFVIWMAFLCSVFLIIENSVRRAQFVNCPLANFYVMRYAGAELRQDYKQVDTQTISQSQMGSFGLKYKATPPQPPSSFTNGNTLQKAAANTAID